MTNAVRLNLRKRKDIRSVGRCLGHVLRAEGYRTLHVTDEVRFSNITPEEGFDVLPPPWASGTSCSGASTTSA